MSVFFTAAPMIQTAATGGGFDVFLAGLGYFLAFLFFTAIFDTFDIPWVGAALTLMLMLAFGFPSWTPTKEVYFPHSQVTCQREGSQAKDVSERSGKHTVTNSYVYVEYNCTGETFFYKLAAGEMIRDTATFYRTEQ